MKKAISIILRVTQILGYVMSFFFLVTAIAFFGADDEGILFGIFVLIYAIGFLVTAIVAPIIRNKVLKATAKSQVISTGVLCIIFVNPVAGILILASPESVFAPQQNPYEQNPYGQNPYGQNPYGQNPYGQNPYGQNPYGQNPYGQNPYGQNPYGQTPYDQPPQNGQSDPEKTPASDEVKNDNGEEVPH